MARLSAEWHAQQVPAQAQVPKKRVLLVNDSRDEREMYAEWLCRQGYCTLQTTNATDGYRMAMELHPDVVVTDIKLSGSCNGLELTRQLKEQPQTHGVPVVILSGYVFKSDSDDAARVGCDLFLGKPCLPEALSHAIERLLIRRA
jgi:two-component system cell cycle response regulator DivK